MTARKDWTGFEIALGVACGALGGAVAILGFTDIFVTVNHVVAPWWGWLAWTVIVLGEGSGLGSYLGWLLLDLRDKPPRRVKVFCACYLSTFAALSLLLNVYAGRGSVPGTVSHGLAVVAFFGYLVFIKVMVRRLSADPAAERLALALADARQHAIDLCRDRRGLLWRYRVPSLLRRQILSGRLADEVREAVTLKVSVGATGGWEATVRTWVFRELNLPALASKADSEAAADIARSAPETAPQASPAASPQARPEARSGPALRLAASKSRSMSAGDLEPHVSAMLDEYGSVSQARVKRDLHVSTEKAAGALRLAKRGRTVVSIGQR
jgi:hypothetical protein